MSNNNLRVDGVDLEEAGSHVYRGPGSEYSPQSQAPGLHVKELVKQILWHHWCPQRVDPGGTYLVPFC